MSDIELLELAAKAHGNCKYFNGAWRCAETGYREFDPMNDDGDAFRLMVKLKLDVNAGKKCVTAYAKPLDEGFKFTVDNFSDPAESARIAIVRVAAEIGKSL